MVQSKSIILCHVCIFYHLFTQSTSYNKEVTFYTIDPDSL
jgi:hypothetical protein